MNVPVAAVPRAPRWTRAAVIAVALTCVAMVAPLLWTRYRRRLFVRLRSLADLALGLPLTSIDYAGLLGEPAKAFRGYLDDGAGRVYALLTRQFDFQLERWVEAAMRQAKAAVIDPDMPRGVSDLISDTLERIGPEISQAIRQQAGTAILRPLVRRLRLGSRGLASSGGTHAPSAGFLPAGDSAIVLRPHGAVTSPARPLLLRRSPPRSISGWALEVLVWMRTATLALHARAATLVFSARAHVLYTLQPFDRSMWACFRDPQYWLFNALGATPIPSWLPAAWWLLVFMWQDGSDEYQVAAFIVGLETAKFLLTGCWGLVQGSARQFLCSTLPLTFPCDAYGPRLSALDALLFFAQIALVWRAFHVLRSLPQPERPQVPHVRSLQRERRGRNAGSPATHVASGHRPALLSVQQRPESLPGGELRSQHTGAGGTLRAGNKQSVLHAANATAIQHAATPSSAAAHATPRRWGTGPPSIRALRSPLWLSPLIDHVLALTVIPEASPSPDSPVGVHTHASHDSFTLPGARRLFSSPLIAPVIAAPGHAVASPLLTSLRTREHLRGLCNDVEGIVSPRWRQRGDDQLGEEADVSTDDESRSTSVSRPVLPELRGVLCEARDVLSSSPEQLLQATSAPRLHPSSESTVVWRNHQRASQLILLVWAAGRHAFESAQATARRLGAFCGRGRAAATRCTRSRGGRRRSAGGGGGTESAIGDAAELYLRRGGALQLLYWYNAAVVGTCFALAALALVTEVWRALDAACAGGSAAAAGRSFLGVSLEPWCSSSSSSRGGGHDSSPPLPPVLWPALYWLRTLYGLSGAPYVAFKLPLVARLYLTPAATGYDQEGRTVPQRIARVPPPQGPRATAAAAAARPPAGRGVPDTASPSL